MTVNRYTKLIKTLKESPTNSMGGVYSLNPQGFDLRKADVAKKFYPGIDGNFPNGIPGSEGDPFYLRPAGFWDGGDDWESYEVSDGSQDYLLEDPTGKSTSGLIADDGSVKAALPPNSRHFILGPLVDGYVPNHGYDNFTNIGYLQKDTRQFVLLARIQGQFTADLHSEGARVWDGTEGQLTIINSNFTLEMAEWFRDQITAGSFTPNVPYFYSGGVPQQPQTPAQCPNCPPNMFGGVGPGTNRQFGTGKLPTLGTQYTNPTPDSGDQLKANIFNLTPDQVKTLAVLLGLGLSIAAVIAVLFPEPGSTAAGGAYLASKFRFAAGLKRSLGQLWKSKPRTYKKLEYPKKSAEDKFFDKMDKLYQQTKGKPISNKPLQTKPGRKRFPVGDSYDHITDVKQKLILETFDKALLNETAPTESGPAGGTEVADAYVNDMADKYDANDLQKASDDANDIAGDQGLTDKQKSDIDREAERRARELNNVNYSRPESMTGDQIDNFYDMAFSVDEEWLDQAYDTYQNLIPLKEIDKAYDEYKEQREYLYTTEWTRTVSSEYNSYKDIADQKWEYVKHLSFDISGTSWKAYYNGREVDTYEAGWGALHDWVDPFRKANKIYDNVIAPERERQREKLTQDLMKRYRTLYRPFDMAVIRAWSQRNVNDDPFGLKDTPIPPIPRGNATYDAASELAMLGISAVVLKALIMTVGATKAATLMKTKVGLTKIKTWWNKGRNVRVPGENQASWKTLRVDDKSQGSKFVKKGSRGKDNLTDTDFEGGAIPTNLDQLGQLLQGKGGFTWQLTRGLKTGPTALTRQLIERPFRTIMKFFESSYLRGDLLTEETSDQKALYDALDAALKETDPKDFEKVIDKFLSMMEDQISQKEPMESYKPKFVRNRKPLTETKNPNQRKILREIRKPVTIKEAPTKYKINFSNQNTSSSQTDELVMKANARGQAWRSENKRWSGYETTEKDNIIQDRVGHGKQAFDYMIEHGTQKSEWRSKEVQEELNKIAHEKAMLKENPDFKSPFGNVEVSTTEKNDDNFNKVSKKIKQIASKDKEVKPEYPDDDQQQKNNMLSNFDKLKKEFEHEKLNTGERASAYYKRLDPTTAKSMPDAAYPQIDNFKNQARKKPK